MRAMSRFFWFTVEFGLMRGARRDLRVWQRPAQFLRANSSTPSTPPKCSGIRCSWNGSSTRCAEIDHYQPILFVVDSFDHLFSEVDRFEQWMRDGKLYNVAPGLPDIAESDLRSFLEAASPEAQSR